MSRIALISGDLPAPVANIIVAELEFAQTLGYEHAEPCDDTVAIGDLWDGSAFFPPDPGPVESPVPTFRTVMTPIRFKAQFSVMAQVKIKRARAYVDGKDPDAASDERKAFARDALDILFGSLDDPRLTEVDVADPSVIGGIDFVHSLGILTADEAAEIKRGVPL